MNSYTKPWTFKFMRSDFINGFRLDLFGRHNRNILSNLMSSYTYTFVLFLNVIKRTRSERTASRNASVSSALVQRKTVALNPNRRSVSYVTHSEIWNSKDRIASCIEMWVCVKCGLNFRKMKIADVLCVQFSRSTLWWFRAICEC